MWLAVSCESQILLTGCAAAGEQLASAGDGGEVFLWKPGSAPTAAFGADEDVPDPGWRISQSLRYNTPCGFSGA